MTVIAAMPKMLWTPTGFYCTYCDYYFFPELDRSGLPDRPVQWIGLHDMASACPSRMPCDCTLEGKMYESSVTEVFPAAREVIGKRL